MRTANLRNRFLLSLVLLLIAAFIATLEWLSHHSEREAPKQVAVPSSVPSPVPATSGVPSLATPSPAPPTAAPGSASPAPVSATPQAVASAPATSSLPAVPSPSAMPFTGPSPPPASGMLASPGPIPSASASPSRVVTLPPDAAPRILSVSLSSDVVAPGDVVSGTVTTSSNVASVEARIGGYSSSLVKVNDGRFALTYRVPSVPWFLRKTYTLVMIARNARGDMATTSLPVTVR